MGKRTAGTLICTVVAALATASLPAGRAAADTAAASEHHGAAAVAWLTSTGQLDTIAARNHLTGDELSARLLADGALFVTAAGDLGYSDTGTTSPGLYTQSAGDTDSATGAGMNDNERVTHDTAPGELPQLASRPGSVHTLLLDFDGHTLVGTRWNTNYKLDRIDAGAYDIDGDPSAFGPDEQDLIAAAWAIVAQDYAPFDVNVTTVDTGADAIVAAGAGDPTGGQRVVITNSDWYNDARPTGPSVAGVAWLDSAERDVDAPVWVFAKRLFPRSATAIGNTASHEAGHAWGLQHDGDQRGNYHRGTRSWAPIMGGAYHSSTIAQWSNGDYPDATNTEDDLAILGARLGYIDDEPDGRRINAGVTTGMLGAGDTDTYTIDAPAGTLTVRVTPSAAAHTNLVAKVEIADRDGEPIAAAAPPVDRNWSAGVAVGIAGGTYTITVAGAGYTYGDGSGYSAYGSTGAYELEVGVHAQPEGNRDGGPPAVGVAPSGGTAGFEPVGGVRLVDTRTSGLVEAGGIVRADVSALGDNIAAVAVNAAAVAPTGAGWLGVWPCNTPTPASSSVNYTAGQTTANHLIVPVGDDGELCVRTSAAAHIIVDVDAVAATDSGARFHPLGGIRAGDTRTSGTRPAAGSVTAFDISGDVPAGTIGVNVNVTAAGPDANGHLTVWPCNQPQPATSSLNYTAGRTRANSATVGVGDGRVCVYTHAATDIIVDVTGSIDYRNSGLTYVGNTVGRILDTRVGNQPAPAPGATVPVTAPANMVTAPVHAVSVNVAAVEGSAGHVTVHDCAAQPPTSTLNSDGREVVAGSASVRVNAESKLCVTTSGGSHLVVDIGGRWIAG